MKYRKLPVVIEAVQWFEGERVDGVLLDGDKGFPLCFDDEYGHRHPTSSKFAYVRTLEGGHIALVGDWIITGVKGEKYPCKPDIFEMTYEPVLG